MVYRPLGPHEQIAADVFMFIDTQQDMMAIGRLISALCDELEAQYEGFDRANFQHICLRGARLDIPEDNNAPQGKVMQFPADKWDEIEARLEFNAEHDPGLGDD